MAAILRCSFRGACGLVVAGALALAASIGAQSASAGSFSTSATPCSGYALSQPFLRFADPAYYTLAPNGGLEAGTRDWTLTSGAKVVRGNETFKVAGAKDAYALSLPSGSSATTRSMCVGLLYPTLRLFALNSGSVLSTLKVEVLYEDSSGTVRSLQVGSLLGSSSWQPTLPIAFLANLNGLLTLDGTTTAVAFRFTPQGSASGWRIDDVYVDPFKLR